MESEKNQFEGLRAKQSEHDPSKLEACPHCGKASTMGKDVYGRPTRLHRIDRGNGMYGYDPANHEEK